MTMTRTVRAAAVQAAPAFLDREATTAQAVALIREAADNGAELVALPETFIPCYPFWIWLLDPMTCGQLYPRLLDQAVTLDGECVATLRQAARDAGVHVACGINERDGGTIYNSQLFLDNRGEVMGVRRKLMPTSAERTVWGRGDARDLQVWETPLGTLGGLICFEHSMALSRAVLTGLGEDIHVAMWPSLPEENPAYDVTVIEAAMRNYGWESQSFVLHASSLFSASMLEGIKGIAHEAMHPMFDAFAETTCGCTGIVDPTGHHIAGPVYRDEQILYADLDPQIMAAAKYMIDSAGHYARPDVVHAVVSEPAPKLVERRSAGAVPGREPSPNGNGADAGAAVPATPATQPTG